jgi:hypothetical protein
MSENDSKKPFNRKQKIVRLVATFIYIIFLTVLFYYLLNLTKNLIIIVLIILFLFLLFLGVILRKGKFNLLSRLFPSLEKKITLFDDVDSEDSNGPPNDINFSFKYKRPLIKKCPECGFTLTQFMKKCPSCGKEI